MSTTSQQPQQPALTQPCPDCGQPLVHTPIPMPPLHSPILADLQTDVGLWATRTFPTSTPTTWLAHLREEVDELEAALATGDKDQAIEEAADVLILLLAIAHRLRRSLTQVTLDKHSRNLARRWLPPDAQGIVRHVPTPSATTVVNLHDQTVGRQDWDVRIDRRSPWGNPFRIGRDGTREECVALYLTWILEQPHLVARLPELRGQRLACWCVPALCHGHVLAALAGET